MTMSQGRPLTVLFDGQCGFCTRCAAIGRALDGHDRVEYLAHQVPGVRERFGVTREQADYQIWAFHADGLRVGGAQAVAAILDTVLGLPRRSAGNARWLRGPLVRIAELPGVAQGLDRAYQWVARNRGRLPGTTPWCQAHDGSCG